MEKPKGSVKIDVVKQIVIYIHANMIGEKMGVKTHSTNSKNN